MDEQPVETTLYSLAALPPKPPKPQKQRSNERHLSLLRVGILTIDGRRELCLIRNVSVGGMLVRAYSDIAVGAAVSIELKEGEPVSGSVSWAKDECLGVTFDSPIDVLALISASNDGPRPRMPRVEVCCTVWVREGATVSRAVAVNVSQGGLRIECPASLTVGAEVIVTMPGLAPEPGTVRWNDDGAYGITFNRVLALSQLVVWLEGQREPQRTAGSAA